MPYENEFANPAGFEAFLGDTFLKERLSTYRTTPSDKQNEDALSNFKPLPASELPTIDEIDVLTHGVAIDGSLSSLEEENYSLSVLKIGYVLQSEASARTYEVDNFVGLMPGEHVYDTTDDKITWYDKFREEFFRNMKHILLPFGGKRSLYEVLRELTPEETTHYCIRCHFAGRLTRKENKITFPYGLEKKECYKCGDTIYFTDFVVNGDVNEGNTSKLIPQLMLLWERLLLLGMVQDAAKEVNNLPLATTVFIVDGPMALFNRNDRFAGPIRKHLQAIHPHALVAGIEKTGRVATFAESEGTQQHLAPGEVAMVTTELLNIITGKPTNSFDRREFYFGKRFIYRNLSGDKTFVFFLMPTEGVPYKLHKEQESAESWDNYPHVKTFCSYLENNATDQFGRKTAALDIIAEANHEASLPKNLSIYFLKELFEESRT